MVILKRGRLSGREVWSNDAKRGGRNYGRIDGDAGEEGMSERRIEERRGNEKEKTAVALNG